MDFRFWLIHITWALRTDLFRLIPGKSAANSLFEPVLSHPLYSFQAVFTFSLWLSRDSVDNGLDYVCALSVDFKMNELENPNHPLGFPSILI